LERAEPFSDNERDNNAGFSDLYLCLVRATLDEISSFVIPKICKRNPAAHVSCGISNHFLIED
jgi:hypothetical protein